VRRLLLLVLAAFAITSVAFAAAPRTSSTAIARIDHVADGDTVDLTNGAKVRLVQIDTPEVFFSPECYGAQASRITKRLLPPGTAVRLTREPATDKVDRYGRLLRYVVRARDGLNVNVYLVRVGAAAPYFFDYRRGRYANLLLRLARRARARRLGLWAPARERRGTRTTASRRGHRDDRLAGLTAVHRLRREDARPGEGASA
jgi:micrococcal nuclease